jgi:hypothetical protein
MSHFAYLAYLVVATGGMLAVCAWRGILNRRLLQAVLVTVPLFVAFDLLGVARGWFSTEPSLNVWILPGGVSVEEIINLAFLTVLSVDLSLGFRGVRHE